MRHEINRTCTALATVALMALASGPVRAQSPDEGTAASKSSVGSFDTLKLRLTLGDTVRVTDAEGRQLTGALADLRADSLTIIAKGAREDLQAPSILRITRENRDSLANGAQIGAAIGAGFMGVLGVACASTEGCYIHWPSYILTTAAYAGIGAAIGVGIDSVIKEHKVVYDRAQSHPRMSLSLAPMLTKQQRGVRLALRW